MINKLNCVIHLDKQTREELKQIKQKMKQKNPNYIKITYSTIINHAIKKLKKTGEYKLENN